MTLQITHSTIATLPDQPGVEINKAEWNDDHVVTGTIDQSQNNVAVDGVTILGDGTPGNPLVAVGDGTGDVHGPASSTLNAVSRYSDTTGKILKDSPNFTSDDSGNTTFETLNLKATTNQIVLDSDGTFTGTLTMSALGANRTWTLPNSTGTILLAGNNANVDNKTLTNTNTITVRDDRFTLQDSADTTKQAVFELSGITASTMRTLTVPDQSGTIALTSTAQANLQWQDEGSNIGTSGQPTTIDFVGAGVSAAYAAGKITVTIAGGSGSPAGSDTQVQFNDGGSFGADAGLTYNKTTDALTVVGIVTGGAFVPSGSTVPTNGMYLPAANTLGWSASSTGEMQMTGTALSPITNDGLALGTTALMWADLFLASGSVINFNNGDVTITHSANTLAFAGASTAYTFATGAVRPSTNDGSALGSATVSWSDLFLASGGVINWNNGDVTITHASDTLTFAGAASGVIFNSNVVINNEIQIDGTPATDDTATGPTTNVFNAGATIAQWDLVYLDASSTWQLADADAASTSGPVMLALAAEAKTSGQAMKVVLPGGFSRNDAWAWTPGAALYVDTTAGGLTQTAPSGAGDIVRVAGYAVNADTVYFMPSGAWVEVT